MRRRVHIDGPEQLFHPRPGDLQQVDQHAGTHPSRHRDPLRVHPVDERDQRRVPIHRRIRRRWLAVAVEGEPPEVVVEEVRDDVPDRPERAHGRTVPVVRAETAEQPDELAMQRPEAVHQQHGFERTERGR